MVKIIEFCGSAGSGKTMVIEKLINRMRYDYKIAIIVANLIGDDDYKIFREYGIKTINVNTGNKCFDYGSFEYIKKEIEDAEYIFIENVGSLLCSFINIKHKKIAITSATQGNIIKKYPLIFQLADVVVISKTDIIENVDDIIKSINEISHARILKTNINGNGMEELIKWITE